MTKRKDRRTFSREFKIEAVRQVIETDRSQAEVARELGVSAHLLGQWKRQLLAEGDVRVSGRRKVSEEELRRLERENRQLRQELEFVKKTAAYFAKERSRGSV